MKSAIPNHLKENIATNILTNIQSILDCKEMILWRNYRVGLVECLLSIMNHIRVNLSVLRTELVLKKIINMMELLLIDKDDENIVKGLKLVMYLG